MSEEYTNYLGDDLALDFVDPDYSPSINLTLTDPEHSNATNPEFSNATNE